MNLLAEFLLARIAEDEERGHSLVAQWWDVGNACQSCGTDGARVLAECDTKRRIVELFRVQVEGPDDRHDFGQYAGRQTLRFLALPYADHPDYDEAWRP